MMHQTKAFKSNNNILGTYWLRSNLNPPVSKIIKLSSAAFSPTVLMPNCWKPAFTNGAAWSAVRHSDAKGAVELHAVEVGAIWMIWAAVMGMYVSGAYV